VTPVAIASVDVTAAPVSRLVRAFLNVFCFALAGYALLGRSFAYLGLPIHPRTVTRSDYPSSSDYPSKRPSGHGERQDSPIPLPDFRRSRC